MTKTNGEAFTELLAKMNLYMEAPPHNVATDDYIHMIFSKEWWDEPAGRRRCAKCGEFFDAVRKNHIYCRKCGEERKKASRTRSHNSEPNRTYKLVYNLLRNRGEDTTELRKWWSEHKDIDERTAFINEQYNKIIIRRRHDE